MTCRLSLPALALATLAGCYGHTRRDAPAPPPEEVKVDLVTIPAGRFTMGDRNGDPAEYPEREITMSGFQIDRTEVTNADYARCVQAKACDPTPYMEDAKLGQLDHPVVGVTWIDAERFCQWVKRRLPTEAEWEYAARGGTKSREFLYSGSNKLDEVGWYEENYKSGNTNGSQKATRPVGALAANELGLYDMSGNVWEWVEDDRHSNYNGAPTDGRVWLDSPRGTNRVLRGGYWHSTALGCRAACRGGNAPARRNGSIGFRLAHQ